MGRNPWFWFMGIVVVGLTLPRHSASEDISGELKKWHRVTITFDGPQTSETADPNPFRDYRLVVEFSNGSRNWIVPGFYAADGNAAETGAVEGNKWRVHFVPDLEGEWTYVASFRQGKDIAIRFNPSAGRPVSFDGASGSFTVGPTDKTGRDFRAKGALRYVGGHYLQFPETGEFFLKGGADSPENFLAYYEFDGTRGGPEAQRGRERRGEAPVAARHRYEPHARDWRPGDPAWRGDRGKNIIGALNYLAGKGMNSVYFLTMNVGGDGKDVWPWIDDDVRDRFDCSKLDQWEIVFSHMDKLGLMLHVVTQEQENDQLLNGGDLGLERKLYYRELVARFGHHLAVTWNLGEENTNTDEQRKAFCEYIRGLRHSETVKQMVVSPKPDAKPQPVIDPNYDTTFIVVHTFPGRYDEVYTPLLGFHGFSGPSLQMGNMRQTHDETIQWIDRSREAGHPWVVCLDEIGPAHTGVKPDKDDPGHDEVRHHALWGNLMAGGGGAEWYFGYRFAHNDLNCEDWRSRENMWDQTRHALDFFQKHLPFAVMRHADGLTEAPDDYCFAEPGVIYAVYLPQGESTKLNLGDVRSDFTVQWYDPRAGGPLQEGSRKRISGPGMQSIGRPPQTDGKDWVALVKRIGDAQEASVSVEGGLASGSYAKGAAVPISAGIPPEGMVFDKWTGDVSTVANVEAAETVMILPDSAATVKATWKKAPPAPAVVSLTLINADTDKPIAGFDPLKDGSTLNLATLPTRNLNVRANLARGKAGSVRFGLDADSDRQTENTAPFALAGDSSGDYNAWTPKAGAHKLTATAYSGPGASGTAGKSLTVRFEVTDRPGR